MGFTAAVTANFIFFAATIFARPGGAARSGGGGARRGRRCELWRPCFAA